MNDFQSKPAVVVANLRKLDFDKTYALLKTVQPYWHNFLAQSISSESWELLPCFKLYQTPLYLLITTGLKTHCKSRDAKVGQTFFEWLKNPCCIDAVLLGPKSWPRHGLTIAEFDSYLDKHINDPKAWGQVSFFFSTPSSWNYLLFFGAESHHLMQMCGHFEGREWHPCDSCGLRWGWFCEKFSTPGWDRMWKWGEGRCSAIGHPAESTCWTAGGSRMNLREETLTKRGFSGSKKESLRGVDSV